MVMAETYAQAKDAAELVTVEYEPLDAVGTLAAAPTGPQIWDDAPNNVCFDWADGDEDGMQRGLRQRRAHRAASKWCRTASAPCRWKRATPSASMTRRATATRSMSGIQGAADLRDARRRSVLNLPVEKLRVITKDVGGGFGMKGFLYPEQPLVLIAAKKTRPPGALERGAHRSPSSPTITAAT